MKELNIRELRAALSHLDELLDQEGEVVIVRRSEAIARLTPVRKPGGMPSHADLRDGMPRLSTGSEEYIRHERDER